MARGLITHIGLRYLRSPELLMASKADNPPPSKIM